MKSSIRKPLMVGPVSGVVTGQLVAFRESCNALCGECVVVDSAFVRFRGLATYYPRLILGAINSNGPIYFTSSRSRIGFFFRDLPIFLIGKLTRRALINHLHGNDFDVFRNQLGKISRRLLDLLYSHISISCAPSTSLLSQYRIYPSMRKIAIPNFFQEHIAKAPLNKSSDGPLEVIFLSNIIYSKGFTIAIEAVDLLSKNGIPVHLTLCGSPIADKDMSIQEIKKILSDCVHKSNITYLGSVDGDKKITVLKRAHVFVLPTTYTTEASPISILEAFAAGCVVIASPQGAIPEMLAGFHAELQPANAAAFCEALKRVNENMRTERVWIENRMQAVRRFSSKDYRDRIRELLKNA